MRYEIALPLNPPTGKLSTDESALVAEIKRLRIQPAENDRLTKVDVKGAENSRLISTWLLYYLVQGGIKEHWGREFRTVLPIDTGATVGQVVLSYSPTGVGVGTLVARGPVEVRGASADELRTALRRDFGIRSVKDTDQAWSPGELAQVAEAFALMPLADRPALAGVDLVRVEKVVSASNPGHVLAAFASTQGGQALADVHELRCSDDLFRDTRSFVGPVANRTYPRSVWTVLHEVGHAVERHAVRTARSGLIRATKDANDAASKFGELRPTLRERADQVNASRSKAYTVARQQAADIADAADKFNNVVAGALKQAREKTFVKATFVEPETKFRDSVAAAPWAQPVVTNLIRLSGTAIEEAKTSSGPTTAVQNYGAAVRSFGDDLSDALDSIADTTNTFAKYSTAVTRFADAPTEQPDIDQVLKDARTLSTGDQDLTQLVDLWVQIVAQRRQALAADKIREQQRAVVGTELVNGAAVRDVVTEGVSRRQANFASYLRNNGIEPRINGYAAERLNDFAELYAETYALWCVAPDFLRDYWPALSRFFTDGNHRVNG